MNPDLVGDRYLNVYVLLYGCHLPLFGAMCSYESEPHLGHVLLTRVDIPSIAMYNISYIRRFHCVPKKCLMYDISYIRAISRVLFKALFSYIALGNVENGYNQ
jgi:hypothetical protein